MGLVRVRVLVQVLAALGLAQVLALGVMPVVEMAADI
jgi:hypothetical protein